MPPPALDSTFHLVLVVEDAVRSAEWYGKVFGFVVVKRASPEFDLRGSAEHGAGFSYTSIFHQQTRMFLGLAQPDAFVPAAFRPDRAGMHHFALHVRERADLDAWARYLDELGIPRSEPMPEGPGLVIRFHDPDGIPVEVCWPDLAMCRQLFTDLARLNARDARERRQRRRMP